MSLKKKIQLVEREIKTQNNYFFNVENDTIKITFNSKKDNTFGYKLWLLFFFSLGILLLIIEEFLASFIPFSCLLIFLINDIKLRGHEQDYSLSINTSKKIIWIKNIENNYQMRVVTIQEISGFHSEIDKLTFSVNYIKKTFRSYIYCKLKSGDKILLIRFFDSDKHELVKREHDFIVLLETVFKPN